MTIEDATGRQTFVGFGIGGQIAKVRDGEGSLVNFGYDSDSLLSELVGPGSERYRYSYDSSGNLLNIRDPLRQDTDFTYESEFNQIASFTDPRGNGIEYAYDSRGNLASITYEDGSSEIFTYDAAGNVLTWTNRRGQTVAYAYNSAGLLTSKDYPDTVGFIDFVYTYDAAGHLMSATDATGTTTMAYDPETDFLAEIIYPGGQSFAFEYDALGRRTRRADQDGNVVNYAYDALGRLDVMADGGGALIVDYDYDGAGRLALKTVGNGVYTTYEYDAAGRVLHLVNIKPDDTVLSRFDYTYDASGRRTSMATLDGTFQYGYDPLGQLTSVIHPDGRIVEYVYDDAGNRIEVINDGVSTPYTTNNLNQYTDVGEVLYEYDEDGNLISKTEAGITTTYTFDVENRLVGVSTPTDTWNYNYDAFGNRVASTHNGVRTHYVLDPIGLGNVAAEYDDFGNMAARYEHGFGLVSRADAMANAAFYTFSGIGSTSEMTDAGGNVLNSYIYDPFGVPLMNSEMVGNPFEFVGEFGVMNEENGLEFMRARFYDSEVGRFIQRDPIGINGGPNQYAYTQNAPVSSIDPSGLDDCGVFPDQCVFPPGLPPGGVRPKFGRSRLSDGPAFGAGVCAGITIGIGISIPNPINIGIAFPGINWGIGGGIGLNIGAGYGMCEGFAFGFDFGYRDDSETTTSVIFISHDPNDKTTKGGFGEEALITAQTTLDYQVRFENLPEALAPAQRVLITDTLDEDLDLDTFALTEIAFANQAIQVPVGLDHFETVVPFDANGTEILVDVRAELDHDTRELAVTFLAIDPQTRWLPENPALGLLFPNDETGRGEGHVGYTVKPKAGLPSGTQITNRASIFFDFNDPIHTPLVLNTLDAEAPMSEVAPLPASSDETTFTLQWSGQDEPLGSGIAGYDIYISVNGGPFDLLFEHTTETSAILVGDPGTTYAFYSIARDNVGHVEAPPLVPDAQITLVAANEPPEIEPISDQMADEGTTLSFTVSASDPDGHNLTFSLDAPPAGATIDPATGLFTWTPDDGFASVDVTARVTDNGSPAQSAARTFTITVNNVAPIAVFSNDGPVGECSTGLVSFSSQIDPSSADTTAGFLYSYDFDNDGTFEVTDSPSASATMPAEFFDDGPGDRTVRGRISDKDGGFTEYTTTITIDNVAPTASLSNDGPVMVGSTAEVRFSDQFDPSTADTIAGFLYSFDFDNDGVFEVTDSPVPSAVVPASFLNGGPGSHIVRARIADKDGGFNDYTTTIDVQGPEPRLEVLNVFVNGEGVAQRSNIEQLILEVDGTGDVQALIDTGEILNVVQLSGVTNNPGELALTADRFRWDAVLNRLAIDLTSDGFGGSQQTLLSDDNYRLRLSDEVFEDTDGLLDGYFDFDFHRLLGDFTGDKIVDSWDRAAWLNRSLVRMGARVGEAGYNYAFDLDGDGDVDRDDYFAWLGTVGNSLP